MSTHATITLEETADRLAIRELIDAYAHFADRRQPDEQATLYADDGRTLVYTDPAALKPAQVLTGHAEHIEGFRTLSQYAATMHFNGQSSVALDGDRATGQSYCLAHHLLDNEKAEPFSSCSSVTRTASSSATARGGSPNASCSSNGPTADPPNRKRHHIFCKDWGAGQPVMLHLLTKRRRTSWPLAPSPSTGCTGC